MAHNPGGRGGAHALQPDDGDDRRSRFQSDDDTGGGSGSLRERAASQPPRSSDHSSFVSSPAAQHFIPSSIGGATASPWTTGPQHRMLSPIRPTNGSSNPNPSQAVPIRSSSFSSTTPTGSHPTQFASFMRERAAFPSTFEDDESAEAEDPYLTDDFYDERYVPPSLSRGRTSYGPDPSRSRSQSLATTITRPIGSPYLGGGGGGITPGMQSWNESFLSNSNPLSSRYGEIKPPTSRYGSLGTVGGRSPINIHSSSPNTSSSHLQQSHSHLGNGYSNRQTIDPSNMSPFVRDVGQILLDDGSAFRELWAGMNPPRDENGGGGSGTTSRRHSVSVVQPRRGTIVGFNAPNLDNPLDDSPTTSGITGRPMFFGGGGRGGGLMISDEELAGDLGLLNINPNEPPPQQRQHHGLPPSQPSSLPIYAPLSRSPPSRELISPYNPISLSGHGHGGRQLGTPTDSDISGGGGSPPTARGAGLYEHEGYGGRGQQQQQQQQHGQGQGQGELTARFIPGQGIQYVSASQHQQQQQQQQHHNNNNGGGAQYVRARAPSYSNISPISPSSNRLINPQQLPFYPQQMHRRPSDASHHQQHHHQHQNSNSSNNPHTPLAELGKGLPLHSVPASWPLFIVEFKAGRTDLFYLTDLSSDIRVGDLVIVEADRGKDLGKVVNDSITLGEVEAFQQAQAERVGAAGFGGGSGGNGEPTSPGGQTKKEINPKMIYGKAGPQDTQLLAAKTQDELKALQLCQTKVRAKKLPMEVIDAEYQWDRRKLTFYFIAEKRIDFRELVRELFRLYKTRIWMASLQGGIAFDQ